MNKPNNLIFSIITCTYNSEEFIGENLKSVKKQIFTDFEHVFVDGESKDKTVVILEKYKKDAKYPVKIVKAPPKGISNAFNVGIKNSKGKYLFFLNSDDGFFDGKVLRDVSEFLRANDELDWMYGKIQVRDGKGKKLGSFPERWIFQRASYQVLKFMNFVPHQAAFVKRAVFEQFGGFDETLKASMDPDLWLRIGNKTKWMFYDRVIANYTVRKGARTSDKRFREENLNHLYEVKNRYLNRFEFFIFKLIQSLITGPRVNKKLMQ